MKKIFSLLLVLAMVTFVSCKKDEPIQEEPTAQVVEPTPTEEGYFLPTLMYAGLEFEDSVIDSLVYLNHTTNVREKFDGIGYTTVTCVDGANSYTTEQQVFTLNEPHEKGSGYDLTIYYNDIELGEYSIFQVLLLEDGQNYCEGVGTQNQVFICEGFLTYTVNRPNY